MPMRAPERSVAGSQPTTLKGNVIDFVTPFIVKSPVTSHDLPFFTIFVLLKVISGYFATSKKSADLK